MHVGRYRAFAATLLPACALTTSLDGLTGGPGDAGERLADGGEHGDAGDAARGADQDVAAPRRCDPTKPFGVASVVVALNTAGDEDGFGMTEDERIAVITRDQDLYIATRSTAAATWSIATKVLASGADDSRAHVSSDGLSLYFDSDRATPGGDHDIFVSRRATRDDPFVDAAVASAVSQGSTRELDPYLTVDGRWLYFSVKVSSYDIYVAARDPATGALGPRALVNSVASSGDDVAPVVIGGGRTMYLARRPTPDAPFVIYRATRENATDGFDTPLVVAELATPEENIPRWASEDDCVIYFVSSRPGGAGRHDIWLATRPP